MDQNDITPVLQRVTTAMDGIGGITAVVLGGSRARDNYHEESDIDIGLYYEGDTALDLERLTAAAKLLDDEHRSSLIAPPGAWGEWVNGGGWLTVNGRQVDLILRDLNRVEQAVADCTAGKITAHYQTGHPHAYLNVMYMGELAICQILSKKCVRIEELRNRTRPYPEKLREAVISVFGFEADFSLMLAEKSLGRNDPYYVAGHLFRSVSCMNQVIFSLNGEYCINEKRAVSIANGFPIKPVEYQARAEHIFTEMGKEPRQACEICRALVREVSGLSG